MYPTNPTRYPEFVADQILTAQNLQDLFNYHDEQQRLTRTNLIGLGIVCGLEAYTASNGNSINIGKGVGVTSAGYLVSVPAGQYTHCSPYNAVKEAYYDKFVDPATKTQRFNLWELAKAGTPEATTELSKNFLSDKIILVFVELLHSGNKNCDPDSCDDKGITVNVQFKFLLVEEKNAAALSAGSSSNDQLKTGPRCIGWPTLKMPRYNVPATTLPDSASILHNYLSILNEKFLLEIEKTLTQAYASTQLLVASDLPNNPFNRFAEKLSFLYDGSINLNQLVMIQYYYDFISDLLQGYDELRSICHQYLATCCPDATLFPRHLLLYTAFPSNAVYRHRFIPSPALHAGDNRVNEMRFLMRRMSAMVQMVQIPPTLSPSLTKRKSADIRITPSKIGDVPLSQKAIPYYYDVLDTPALFNQWNFDLTQLNKGNTNLSYYSRDYNTNDDHVRFPLKYDLEPYNFLRIEGHIGKPWQTAFQEIYQLKYQHRLPFEVVALNGDFKTLLAFVQQSVSDLSKVLAAHPEQWRKILCYFTDIEMQYDMQAAELRCTIGKVMLFLYNLLAETAAGNTGKPVSVLLQKFDAAYTTKTGTVGRQFDDWYPDVKNAPYIAPAQLLGSLSVNVGAGRIISPLALMYYLEKMEEALPGGIVQLQLNDLQTRLRDAGIVANAMLKAMKNMAANTDNKQLDDPEYYFQLNAVIRICKGSLLLELYRNFIFRFYLYLSNQSFAMFAFLNSGIQHKGGVPIGGTFVMVYHDAMADKEISSIKESAINKKSDKTAIAAFDNKNRISAQNESLIAKINEQVSAIRKMDTSERMFAVRKELSKVQSVKDTGMFYMAEVVAARAAEDELTNKELLELVEDIPDGTVIADFYLPYICASECMPMSFVVLGKGESTEEPEKPTLTISPNEFCNNQVLDIALTITPTPLTGNLTGEGASIKNGTGFFNPASVNLNGALQKEVVLTYNTGAASVTNKVTVFAAPKAAFIATPSPSGTLQILLSNVVANGSIFSWSLSGKEISTSANPQVIPVEKPGNYTVRLVVKNGVCTEAIAEQTVTIGKPQPVSNCAPITQWLDAFAKWNQPGQRQFTVFIRQYPFYDKIAALFLQQIPAFATLPVAKQVAELANVAPPADIVEWMQALNKFILEGGPFRSLALELYRILEGLLLFYACTQQEDIGAAKVPTEAAFKMDAEIISTWANAAATFTDAEREITKRKKEDIAKELENVKANAPDKKNYFAFLNRIQKLLDAFN